MNRDLYCRANSSSCSALQNAKCYILLRIEQENPMKNPGFYGWKLLFAFWIIVLINLAFPIYGSSVLNSAMMLDLSLDRRMLGLIFSLFTIMSGLPGPLVALSVERFGVRYTLFWGSLMVAVGAILMATIVNTGLLAALAFGIIVGSGVATGGVVGAQAGLARWFFRRRALVLAIISTASAVGGFIAAPLLNQVIALAKGNWRIGWWLIAAFSCIAAAIALRFSKEKPDDLGQQPDGGAADPQKNISQSAASTRSVVYKTTENWSTREVMHKPFYWLMMFCQMGMSCGYTTFIPHGVVHFQDLGHTREMASWAISMMALAGLISKAIVGVFGDRIDPRYLWASFIAIFGMGGLLVAHADTHVLLIASSACLGIGFGGGVVCLAAVLSNYFGMKAFAFLAGLALAINTTLGSVAPSLAGWLYDKGYGYQGVFYTVAVWCLLGSAVLFFMAPPIRKLRTEFP
jgi:MFS family permease